MSEAGRRQGWTWRATGWLPGVIGLLALMALAVPAALAAGIPGTARLSGRVTADAPFTAAQVYALNRDRSMLYMVYTAEGAYAAPNLVPGAYEVWAEKGDLRSEHQMLRIEAGADVRIDHALAPGPDFLLTLKDSRKGGPQFGARPAPDAKFVTYDEMYPDEPGRSTAEATCMRCHGQGFLPGQKRSREEWVVLINVMLDAPPADERNRPQGSVGSAEREVLADYLTRHFGPGSPSRALAIDAEYPLDEKALSKAMFVEWLLPLMPGLDIFERSPNVPGKHRTHKPHLDDLGNIWASNGLIGLAKLDPRTGQYSHYPLGTDLRNPEVDMYGRRKGDPASVWQYIFPHDITVDANHEVWWAEFQGQHIGRLDPFTGKMRRYPMDPGKQVVDENGVVGNARGHSPHPDAAQNIWFTVIRGNKLGRWDRASEQIRLWEIPTPNSFPYGIEITADQTVWWAELRACQIGRFDPRTEKFREYRSPSAPCAINRLVADSKGDLWYSVFSSGKLGRLEAKTGRMTEYDVVPFTKLAVSAPYGIIADHSDRIWFGDGGLGGALINFDPAAQRFTYYPLPRQGDNPNLDLTRDGAIVYTTRSSNQATIGMFFPDVGRMTTYAAFR
jgi:virginiamycin B lyase